LSDGSQNANISVMRWIVISFFVASLGLQAGEPSEAVLALLRKIQAGESSKVAPEGLAISPFCGPEKKAVIDDRWSSRVAWLQATDFKLSPHMEKVDDDLAAVLIGARAGSNPEAASVISLGLVKKEGAWKIAPLEGDFDNVGLGFGAGIKSRVRALERWMALEKSKGIGTIRKEQREQFRKSMEGVVDAEKLKLEDPEDVLIEFLEAAHKGETDKLLVWQGILERNQLPERDWDRHIQATRKGVKTQDLRSAWRILRSNKVMKVIVEGQGDTEEADYLVIFLSTFRPDPSSQSLNPVRFHLLMTDQGWRIRLPAFFAFDQDDLSVHEEATEEEREQADSRSAREMGYVFEYENDAIRAAEARAVLDGVIGDLKSGNLVAYLQRHFREEEKFEDEDEEEEADDEEEEEFFQNRNGAREDIDDRRMERYQEAMGWWGDALGRGETIAANFLKLYREGDLALGVFTLPNDENSWKPRYQELWMAKEEEGWMILPGLPVPFAHSIAPALVEAREKISKQYLQDRPEFQKAHLTSLVQALKLDKPAGEALDEPGALRLVKEWHKVAGQGTMADLTKISAVRSLPKDPDAFLRDLGYLRASASASKTPNVVLGSKASGRFRGVSLEVDAGEGIEPVYPLAIVVPVEGAHRVLTDIEFPLETNRGLRMLNKNRLKGLTKEMKKEDLAAIVELRDWHQNLARPAWDQWNLDHIPKAK
jgi:hypothetical protein